MYLFYSLMSFSILSTINIFNQFVNNYSLFYNNSLLLSSGYINSKNQKIDNDFYLIVNEINKGKSFYNLNNKKICYEILNKIAENKGNSNAYLNRFKIASETKSLNFKLINSCAISNGEYRIVFINNSQYKSIPTFFSCKTTISSYCKFEIDSSI